MLHMSRYTFTPALYAAAILAANGAAQLASRNTPSNSSWFGSGEMLQGTQNPQTVLV
jgi:hypothetical protein